MGSVTAGEAWVPPPTHELTVSGGRVVRYCCYGSQAGLPVVSLAGIRASLYVGSWSNWVADPARPVATGPERG